MAPGNRKDPKRSTASESQYTLLEFMRDFPDDETCLNWLWQTRYETSEPGHAQCDRCEEIRPFKRYETKQQRQSWTCTACGLHIHPTAGTIFHKSSTGLHLWFYAIYLMTSTRCGISAKQLERELGVTYKTAWRMFYLIRNELMSQDDSLQLAGSVEMDETYMAGKARASDRPKWAGLPTKAERISVAKQHMNAKTATVFGMVERGGRVRADAGLKWYGWDHRTISHRDSVYVSGDIHTQTIEGFWSLVKRGISGSHHSVSRKHLQGYLNEYVWRYNHRDDPRAMFDLLLQRAAQ